MNKEIKDLQSSLNGGKPENLCPDFHKEVKKETNAIAEKKIRDLKRMTEIEEEEAKMKVKWSKLQKQAVMRGIDNAVKKHRTAMKEKEQKDWGRLRRRIKDEQLRKEKELQDDVRRRTTEQLKLLQSVGYKVVKTDGGPDEYKFVPICSTCSKASGQLMLCEECMVTWYCDEWCQRKDWEDRHCYQCKSLQTNRKPCVFPFKVNKN
jgi:Skp family chaperone for outer membrane proteins